MVSCHRRVKARRRLCGNLRASLVARLSCREYTGKKALLAFEAAKIVVSRLTVFARAIPKSRRVRAFEPSLPRLWQTMMADTNSKLAQGQITRVAGGLMGASLPVDSAKLAYSRSVFQAVLGFD